jgi:hypothetical protein
MQSQNVFSTNQKDFSSVGYTSITPGNVTSGFAAPSLSIKG